MAIIGPLPNILQDGTPADAVPVMADFNWIVAQVNLNAVGTDALLPYALLNSPTFTGIPAGPTAAVNDNSTQFATDAFVQAQLVNNAYAPLASPALTGAPTAPTQAFGAYNTKLATTAFVENFGIGTAGSAYRNVTGSRSFGSTQTNTIGGPLTVAVNGVVPSGNSILVVVAGATILQQGNLSGVANTVSVYFIVPPGATYECASGGTLTSWLEW
jgi:hypothetical protein